MSAAGFQPAELPPHRPEGGVTLPTIPLEQSLAERAARHLADRLGEDAVTAHHGSLARDHRLDATARLTWRFADQWSLSPYVTVIRTQSNIALYNFNKTEGGLLLRFELN